jgi:hypothetical protein
MAEQTKVRKNDNSLGSEEGKRERMKLRRWVRIFF